MEYSSVEVTINKKISIITLNRPDALNALNQILISELNDALNKIEKDNSISVVILKGSKKVFAAGADIKDMIKKDFKDLIEYDFIAPWERISTFRKPIIAGVAGYALGGGCEIAMMCDFIIAADNAKFSQPEINLGTFPAAGGTQRLPRFIGKAKAMELILTGRLMDAKEAEKAGLVNRVVAVESLDEELIKVAENISSKSLPILMLAKESVNRAFETNLKEGILFERRLFQSTFALNDRKEGMDAFINKRKPNFQNN